MLNIKSNTHVKISITNIKITKNITIANNRRKNPDRNARNQLNLNSYGEALMRAFENNQATPIYETSAITSSCLHDFLDIFIF